MWGWVREHLVSEEYWQVYIMYWVSIWGTINHVLPVFFLKAYEKMSYRQYSDTWALNTGHRGASCRVYYSP